MKKVIIALGLLTLSACTKSTNNNGNSPVSTTGSVFNITLNGHSYNVTTANSTVATPIAIIASTRTGSNTAYSTGNSLPASVFVFNITVASNTQLNAVFTGIKSDMSSGTGIYKVGAYPDLSLVTSTYIVYGEVNITDYGDGGKVYTSADSTSTVTITTSNGTEVKGTFTMNLFYNGTYYPATGSFDYKL